MVEEFDLYMLGAIYESKYFWARAFVLKLFSFYRSVLFNDGYPAELVLNIAILNSNKGIV